jgi:hypothetical protein
MYITGDTLTLLREEKEEDVVIAACEGVVGWIKKGDVDFGISTPTKSRDKEEENGKGIPDTIISSPTPPTRNVPLPSSHEEDAEEEEGDGGLEVDAPTPDSRRASGPFDLGTPNHSPGLDKDDDMEFFNDKNNDNDQPPLPAAEEMGRDEETQRRIRESYRSSASSGLGGIGGFMLGNGGGIGDDSMRLETSGLKGNFSFSLSGQERVECKVLIDR